MNRLNARVSSPVAQPALQDPYAYYRAFVDTNAPSTGTTEELRSDDDGDTSNTATIGYHDFHNFGDHQLGRARAIPSHLAVRFANRSIGAPLATIVEQSSYSTLNSGGSLLSMSRFPSIRIVEQTSPDGASHRVSRSLDENILHRIQEDATQDQDVLAVCNEAHVRRQDGGQTHPVFDTTSQTTAMMVRGGQRSPGFQTSDADYDADNRKLKGFLCGVLQNVRTTPRTRSRSSSMTHGSVVEPWGVCVEASDSSPLPGNFVGTFSHAKHAHSGGISAGPDSAQIPVPSTASTPVVGTDARSRMICLTNPQTPATIYPPLLESSLPLFEPDTPFGDVTHLLSPPTATHSRERTSSVHLVHLEPRDVAYAGATARAATPTNRHYDNTSAHQKFSGDSAPNHSTSSLKKHPVAKEASRNGSSCSTRSTSYSGTVLGIDLDLQYETPRPVRQSSSPMPV